MLRSKKQESEDRAKEELRQELESLNSQGRALQPRPAGPEDVCATRHPIELARKLARKFPGAEFSIVVPGDGYDDQDYKIQIRTSWKDAVSTGDPPDSEYRLREAVEQAKKQLKQLRELPAPDSLKLYAQGVSDALGEAAKVRKELDEIKQTRDRDRDYPRFMFHPYFR